MGGINFADVLKRLEVGPLRSYDFTITIDGEEVCSLTMAFPSSNLVSLLGHTRACLRIIRERFGQQLRDAITQGKDVRVCMVLQPSDRTKETMPTLDDVQSIIDSGDTILHTSSAPEVPVPTRFGRPHPGERKFQA